MAVRFRAAAGTHLGTVRMNNEDSAAVSDNLLILADGMGGHAAGEVASVLTTRVFSEVERTPGADLGGHLLAAGHRARRALMAISDADPVLESLGTTVIAVVTDGEQVLIGHIGDSRAYVLRQDSMYQVTTDHTHVQRMVESGQITSDQARIHPYRAMLLKSLDDHYPGPEPDVIEVNLEQGDRLLLCSDGLSDYLTAEEIGRALATADRDEAVQTLIDSALAAATRDNVTVVVADVETGAQSEAVLTDPGYAGAVLDGIQLSTEAARALADALPGFHLDPDEPWRGSGLEVTSPVAVGSAGAGEATANPGEGHDGGTPVAASVAATAGATSGDDVPSRDTPAALDAALPADTPDPSGRPRTRPGGDGSREPEPVPTNPGATTVPEDPSPSVLPGVLAGAFTLTALALLALFLFG